MNNSLTQPRVFGVWARMPLFQKLLAGFGALFLLTLGVALISLYNLNRETIAYQSALDEGVEVRRLATQLQLDLLEARRAEKNFLLRWRSEGFDTAYANYVTEYEKRAANIHAEIESLRPFAAPVASNVTANMTEEQYNANIAEITDHVNIYETSFFNIVDAYQREGSTENSGFEGQFRTAAHAIEVVVSGKPGLEALEISYLKMRRAEKDYLERGAQEHVDAVHTQIAEMRELTSLSETLTPAEKSEIRKQLTDYEAAFDALVKLDAEITQHDAELIAASRAVEPLADALDAAGRNAASEKVSEAETAARQAAVISYSAIALALGIATLLAFFIAGQITRPVLSLTQTAQQIAGGDFTAKAEQLSADEVGSLAQTFNLMTERLGQAFEDVRRRALAVQTSAEVSRRLSVATNTRQLAVDVVEQAQAAFHYYHAHIYFFDEAREFLVMAGGTGEAGAVMLASGHKIPAGRGLVGRAADTHAPVLVPDVSKEEGWLPNPLLPETKAEAAIPILLGNTTLGVLDVQQNVVNGLSAEDVELLQSLAGQVAISYQNARSFEQSKAQADYESLVNAIGQKIQRATSVEETLQTAVRELGLALGAQRVHAMVSKHEEDSSQN